MTDQTLSITCAPELEPYLAEEVRALGLNVVSEQRSVVVTEGDDHDMMRLNLHLRTALHVFRPLLEFRAPDPDELYAGINSLPWEELIPTDGYVSVTSNVQTPSIDNTMFASLRVKDAIVDRIMERCGRRPDSGPDRDHAVVHLFWRGDRAVINIDTSGRKLADRGYRRSPHRAPLAEPLAAALLIAAGYDGSQPLALPMCGSGTLAVEAALIATGRAPGLLRSNFGFMHLAGHDEEKWQAIRRDARKAGRAAATETPGRIVATDIDEEAIEAAHRNAVTAGVEHLLDFAVCDFEETWVPEGNGIVMLNPEYGERMGEVADLEATYSRIGDFFKQHCGGHHAYVFTGSRELAGKIGLKAKRRMVFFNAEIECRLLEFEIYAGSRR